MSATSAFRGSARTGRARHGLVLLEMLLALALVASLWIGTLTLPRTLDALERALAGAAAWHASAHAALQCVHDDLMTGTRPEIHDPARGVRLSVDATRLHLRKTNSMDGAPANPLWITYHLDHATSTLIRTESFGAADPVSRTLVGDVTAFEIDTGGERVVLTLRGSKGRIHARSFALLGIQSSPRTPGGGR